MQVRHDVRQERTTIEARREERLERLPVERPSGEAMRLNPSIPYDDSRLRPMLLRARGC